MLFLVHWKDKLEFNAENDVTSAQYKKLSL